MRVLLNFVDGATIVLGASFIVVENVSKFGVGCTDCITLLSVLESNDGFEEAITGEVVDVALMLDADA